MNIENLEAFVHVNHFGSINKASKVLFLSQPSVSSRIKSLERELGAQLFERSGRRLILTEKGSGFLPFAENMVDTLKKGKAYLDDSRNDNRLTVASSSLASCYLLPDILAAVKKVLPELNVKIITAPSEEVVRMVSRGEADLGFASNVSAPGLSIHRALESPIRLIVPQGHGFIGSQPDAEKLSGHTIVFFACGSMDWTMVNNLFMKLERQPDIKYEVDSMETAKGIILNHSAIGFLPELSVRREIEGGLLHAIDIPQLTDVALKTDMIYRENSDSASIKEVISIIGETAYDVPAETAIIDTLYK
ncbi:LysR family transcriptional regulator [Salinicoccus sediminis]|uniref:LysR family transcriptional regulator n=1 Tax=Salinicoccus sediminis TaxID=1432562 RepID=UPI00069A6195|nr:LysR family transcriptional regulator [Salinicoccus sediminis]